jgi:hypothetical protein
VYGATLRIESRFCPAGYVLPLIGGLRDDLSQVLNVPRRMSATLMGLGQNEIATVD